MTEEGFRLKKFLNKTTQQLLKNSKDHISYKTNMMKGLLEEVNMARGWSEEFLRISFVLDIQPMA